MEFFETPEEMAAQLEKAKATLKEFEDRSDFETLMSRLKEAHPLHPALLARLVFLLLALIGLTGALVIAAVTLLVEPEKLPKVLTDLDAAVGMPLPVILGIFAVCLGIAYVGATQAALQIARDCPLLPHEQRDHERLLNEVKRLSSQKAIMDRVRGTPMGARPRGATPAGVAGRAMTPTSMPTRAGSLASAPSYGAPVRSGTSNSLPSYITQPTRPGSMNSEPPPAISMPTSQLRPERAGTPLGAVPRAGKPVGKLKKDNGEILNPDRLKTLSPDEDTTMSKTAPSLRDIPQVSEPAEDDPFAAPVKVVPTLRAPVAPSSSVGFEQKYATHFPTWGPIDEPWLEDAVQKAEILATGFPVQSRLWFSSEANLPFALILERATPAMAVRAMVSFVEFLASINTPKRARIVLRSVPHLDRGFHRNVEAALEPYFGEKVDVSRAGDLIEIVFKEPDPCWEPWPWLPLET